MSENAVLVEIGNTELIAHRGLSGYHTENSSAAFAAAGKCNYYGIETDLRRSKDGIFVTIHDPTTRRVADDNLTVSENDYSRLSELNLKKLSSDSQLQHIPTLKEYISICKLYEKKAVIELKERLNYREITRLCLELEALDYFDKCIFISFKFENLFLLRIHRPFASAQYLVKKEYCGLFLRLKLHRIDLDIKASAVTPELVERYHSANLKINCWTVDKPSEAEKLADMGVDFITTNLLEKRII